MIRRESILFSITISILLAGPLARAADWLQWRGPQGTGQSEEKSAPLTWSKTENVKWKVALDGPGNSTPIVVGQKVFITHAPAKSPLRGIQCYDRGTGNLRWKHQVEYTEPEDRYQNNPLCAASPVSDGQRVVAWYGSAGLFCYDLDGKILWQKDLGKVEHIWEYGSSPLIHENLVVLNFGPGVNAFVAAFDKATGQEVWRKTYAGQPASKKEEYCGSWNTPVVFQEGSRKLLLLSLPMKLWAVDPKTGEEVWSCRGLDNKLVYTSPLIAGNIVIAMGGFSGPALAVKGGGQGDVTETNRLWHHTQRNPQRVGSGVVVGDYIYILNEPGIAWCLEAKTGEKKWEERMSPKNTWSSMVHAAGRLYVANKDGTIFVLEPSPEACKVLAENKLGEQIDASPAFSNGQIFIRTHQNLYCIEAK